MKTQEFSSTLFLSILVGILRRRAVAPLREVILSSKKEKKSNVEDNLSIIVEYYQTIMAHRSRAKCHARPAISATSSKVARVFFILMATARRVLRICESAIRIHVGAKIYGRSSVV